MAGRREHDGARDEVLRRRAGKILRARRALRQRHILGGRDELCKLRIGDLGRVHPEAIDVDPVERPGVSRGLHPDIVHARLLGGAHGELTARNPHHALRPLPWWRGRVLNGGLDLRH